MKDVMLDIETLGVGENPCIVQIGACFFDRTTGEIGATFDRNIHAATNGEMDATTVYWWLSQSEAARASILKNPRLDLRDALSEFDLFLNGAPHIWSHATFDFVIISHAFRAAGFNPRYRSALDIRTLIHLAGIDKEVVHRVGTHHNALDDAKHQVKYCVVALKRLAENRAHQWER